MEKIEKREKEEENHDEDRMNKQGMTNEGINNKKLKKKYQFRSVRLVIFDICRQYCTVITIYFQPQNSLG